MDIQKQTVQSKYQLKPITRLGARKKASVQRVLFNSFLPKLPMSANVLEIGPGRGEFASECISQKLSYLGIEPSKELYQNLKHIGFEVINDKVPPIPVESERFDLIHSNAFVEHLCSYREVMEFFFEAYRILKKTGYISVIAPNYQTIRHLFFQYEYQHAFITTPSRLKNMLIDCGFEIVTIRCFLLSPSPKLKWVDRLIAHTIIPLLINSLTQGLVTVLISEEFLYRIHKNLFDQVAILAKKPPY